MFVRRFCSVPWVIAQIRFYFSDFKGGLFGPMYGFAPPGFTVSAFSNFGSSVLGSVIKPKYLPIQ